MLIDKSELLKAYDEAHNGPPGKARRLIEEAPGVEIVPVKHGKWVMMGGMKPPEYHHHHQCSVCESYAPMRPPMGYREELSPWCPACGSKMDLEGLDDHNGTD